MHTEHEVIVGDARELHTVDDESVELVVTSPPYPMIEMWDDLFTDLNPQIAAALSDGDGDAAFEAMHAELATVWSEVARVLVPGGIVVINVGDATRNVDSCFKQYPNHARVIEWFSDANFNVLPDVLWRKPSNKVTKFLGSGMVPPNAYASLEHEYLLTFRKGERRQFEPGLDRRYQSAYFWEERNSWFSDLWTDVYGAGQDLGHDELRQRSAAFPLAVPYRLINMYSIYGDTVLDPFWGTGTTSIAAMVAGRNSVGFELRPEFVSVFDERVDSVPALSRELIAGRIDDHRTFVDERRENGSPPAYEATNYDFPVTTTHEQEIQFYEVESVERTDDRYVVKHVPFAPEFRR